MIGLVSESLKRLLEGHMTGGVPVTLLSPNDTSSHQKRLNLFLYCVKPNPQLRNLEAVPDPEQPDRLVAPPLMLTLNYLMTAYAPLDDELGQAATHTILAEAMRVLHDHAIVPAAFLEEGLPTGDVKVTIGTADVEELSKIWTAIDKDYRLSVAYDVSFVPIPAAASTPMARRVDVAAAQILPGARRPFVREMTPRNGPAGTSLQFNGEALTGRRADIRFGGRIVASDLTADDDRTLLWDLPADIAVGVYDVDVDLAGLARFADVFEVTP